MMCSKSSDKINSVLSCFEQTIERSNEARLSTTTGIYLSSIAKSRKLPDIPAGSIALHSVVTKVDTNDDEGEDNAEVRGSLGSSLSLKGSSHGKKGVSKSKSVTSLSKVSADEACLATSSGSSNNRRVPAIVGGTSSKGKASGRFDDCFASPSTITSNSSSANSYSAILGQNLRNSSDHRGGLDSPFETDEDLFDLKQLLHVPSTTQRQVDANNSNSPKSPRREKETTKKPSSSGLSRADCLESKAPHSSNPSKSSSVSYKSRRSSTGSTTSNVSNQCSTSSKPRTNQANSDAAHSSSRKDQNTKQNQESCTVSTATTSTSSTSSNCSKNQKHRSRTVNSQRSSQPHDGMVNLDMTWKRNTIHPSNHTQTTSKDVYPDKTVSSSSRKSRKNQSADENGAESESCSDSSHTDRDTNGRTHNKDCQDRKDNNHRTDNNARRMLRKSKSLDCQATMISMELRRGSRRSSNEGGGNNADGSTSIRSNRMRRNRSEDALLKLSPIKYGNDTENSSEVKKLLVVDPLMATKSLMCENRRALQRTQRRRASAEALPSSELKTTSTKDVGHDKTNESHQPFDNDYEQEDYIHNSVNEDDEDIFKISFVAPVHSVSVFSMDKLNKKNANNSNNRKQASLSNPNPKLNSKGVSCHSDPGTCFSQSLNDDDLPFIRNRNNISAYDRDSDEEGSDIIEDSNNGKNNIDNVRGSSTHRTRRPIDTTRQKRHIRERKLSLDTGGGSVSSSEIPRRSSLNMFHTPSDSDSRQNRHDDPGKGMTGTSLGPKRTKSAVPSRKKMESST